MVSRRKIVQVFTALITNLNLRGFWTGTIYRGVLKNICVPGLNCYSCPGALGSCPIGSLQAVIGSIRYQMSYYVVGLLALFGGLAGRYICGWLCPFGLIQELLYKIPTAKLRWNKKNSFLRFVKYGILVIFVILLPAFVVDFTGLGAPAFCKYICPAGTLEAGVPLILTNPQLQAVAGVLFNWKLFLLFVTIIMSVIIFRPFCYVVCPLGAIYAFFNKISLYQIKVDKQSCTSCQACARVCKMNVYIAENPTSAECIRCGDCVADCPVKALSSGIKAVKHDQVQSLKRS